MFQKRIAITTAVLALAVMPAFALAQDEEERVGETIFANVIDASVKNADLLADGMKGQAKLDEAVGQRDVRVIQVEQILDDREERMLADTIDASTVLSGNRLLARNAAMPNECLSRFMQENAISADRVVAIDVMTQPADAVTLYVLDVPELSSPPTVPGPTGTR